MRAKLKDGNQLILADEVALALHGVEFVEIEVKDNRLIFTPDPRTAADAVREKLAKIGINEQDIADAVAWARKGGDPIAPDK